MITQVSSSTSTTSNVQQSQQKAQQTLQTGTSQPQKVPTPGPLTPSTPSQPIQIQIHQKFATPKQQFQTMLSPSPNNSYQQTQIPTPQTPTTTIIRHTPITVSQSPKPISHLTYQQYHHQQYLRCVQPSGPMTPPNPNYMDNAQFNAYMPQQPHHSHQYFTPSQMAYPNMQHQQFIGTPQLNHMSINGQQASPSMHIQPHQLHFNDYMTPTFINTNHTLTPTQHQQIQSQHTPMPTTLSPSDASVSDNGSLDINNNPINDFIPYQNQPPPFTGGNRHISIQHNTSKTNLYIKGLTSDTTDDDLLEMCKSYGQIKSTKAIIDKTTQKCKGYGFVDYHNPDDALTALRELKKCDKDVQLAKQREQDPTNLYFANLPSNIDEKLLTDMLQKKFNTNVNSTRIMRERNGDSKCVGFARIEESKLCEQIINELNNKPFPSINGVQIDTNRLLLVKLADSGGNTFNYNVKKSQRNGTFMNTQLTPNTKPHNVTNPNPANCSVLGINNPQQPQQTQQNGTCMGTPTQYQYVNGFPLQIIDPSFLNPPPNATLIHHPSNQFHQLPPQHIQHHPHQQRALVQPPFGAPIHVIAPNAPPGQYIMMQPTQLTPHQQQQLPPPPPNSSQQPQSMNANEQQLTPSSTVQQQQQAQIYPLQNIQQQFANMQLNHNAVSKTQTQNGHFLSHGQHPQYVPGMPVPPPPPQAPTAHIQLIAHPNQIPQQQTPEIYNTNFNNNGTV